MTKPLNTDLIDMLETPLELFGALYESVAPHYTKLSNDLYTRPQARDLFENLSDQIFDCLRRSDAPAFSKDGLDRLRTVFEHHMTGRDYPLLCMACLKALGEYVGRYFGSGLVYKPLRVGNILITRRPPNPIYENLQNPVRAKYGTGIDDITGVFKSVSIIPETNPRISLVENEVLRTTNNYFRKRCEDGIRIAVTPFAKAMEFEIGSLVESWPADEKTPYWFKRITHSDFAKARLIELLEACSSKGIDVLVLPELTVDGELLEAARVWLKQVNRERVSSGNGGLLLLVAGSFHMGEDENELYNLSTVLNHRGETVWDQKKMERFSFDERDLKKAPWLAQIFKTSHKGGYERIRSAGELYCADTPLGRIAVCICIDYFHKKNQEALRLSGINLFLVPAMTNQVVRFRDTARMLGATNQASSFIANSRALSKEDDTDLTHKSASFYYLPDTRRTFTHAVDESADLLIFELRVND